MLFKGERKKKKDSIKALGKTSDKKVNLCS